jgi:ATP-dependent RNA helicase DeaD
VLDEADEMLDMGFAEDLETILTATPDTRQTALFAATMAPRIAAIAEKHLTKPARVTIKGEKRAAGKLPRVRQAAFITSRPQKAYALGRILEFEDPRSAIVFCRTRIEVDELTETLASHGYVAQALHGGMDQRQRDRVMQRFRQEQTAVLVATDVAARGLDIDHVSHVINYDIPTAPEVYVHRIGRTGRIGREGVAITLVDPREQRLLRQIEAVTRQPIEIVPLPTEAALHAKRQTALRAAIETRINAGGLDQQRTFIATLAHDLDLMDVAAAALSLLQKADDSANVVAPPDEPTDAAASTPTATIFVGVGRSAGIRPGDLVGAIANQAGVAPRQLGKVTISPHHSLVEVPEALVDRVIRALQRTSVRGKRVEVRRHQRDGPQRKR